MGGICAKESQRLRRLLIGLVGHLRSQLRRVVDGVAVVAVVVRDENAARPSTRWPLSATRAPRSDATWGMTSDALVGLSRDIFWTVRRELALVLRDRAGDANADLVAAVEKRILTEGPAYYDRYVGEAGQADWRSHALDAAIWLRLNMLEQAGRLSAEGTVELAAGITVAHGSSPASERDDIRPSRAPCTMANYLLPIPGK